MDLKILGSKWLALARALILSTACFVSLQSDASFVYYLLDGGSGTQEVIVTGLRMNSRNTYWGPIWGSVNTSLVYLKGREGSGSANPTTLTPAQVKAIKDRVFQGLSQLKELSEILLALSERIVDVTNRQIKSQLLAEYKAALDQSASVYKSIIADINKYGDIYEVGEKNYIFSSLNHFSSILANGRAFYAKQALPYIANDTSVGDTYASSSKSRQATQIYNSGGYCSGGICYLAP